MIPELTTLCYLERDGQYLMLHRVKKEKDVNAGKWIGVGGHFERDESPEDCMCREVTEETGLIPTQWRFRGIVTFLQTGREPEYMHLFTVSRWEGVMHPSDEGDLAWVDKTDIPALPLWEGDRIFLKLLQEDAPFFSLKLSYEGDTLVSAVCNGEPLSHPV